MEPSEKSFSYVTLVLLVLCCLITVVLGLTRINFIYLDGTRYIWMSDSLLSGDIYAYLATSAPFRWRILYVLISLPLAALIGSQYALALVSLVMTLGVAVCVFFLSKRYVKQHGIEADIIAAITTIVIMTNVCTTHYGANPMTDSMMVFFMLIVVLDITQDKTPSKLTGIIQMLGMAVRETFIFVSVHRILIKRDRASVLMFIASGLFGVIIRVMLVWGTQPLAFHLPPDGILGGNFLYAVMLKTWTPILATSLFTLFVCWLMRYRFDGQFKVFFTAVLAYLPIVYLGLFHAYFGPRFMWPIIVMTAVYLAPAIEGCLNIMMERLWEWYHGNVA